MYDGSKALWTEDEAAACTPVNAYGRSKADAEAHILVGEERAPPLPVCACACLLQSTMYCRFQGGVRLLCASGRRSPRLFLLAAPTP